MEGKKYSVSVRTPNGAPPEYAAHALEAGRRKAGNELYNILWGYKLPAVVDIEEISKRPQFSDPYSYHYEHELAIEITVTPVRHRHVVMPSYDFLAFQHSVQPTASGVGMRARFGNWLARLGNRIANIGGG